MKLSRALLLATKSAHAEQENYLVFMHPSFGTVVMREREARSLGLSEGLPAVYSVDRYGRITISRN